MDFQGSIARLDRLLSTRQSTGSPRRDARLASPLRGYALVGGLRTRWVCSERFQLCVSRHIAFSFREIGWRNPVCVSSPTSPIPSPSRSPTCPTIPPTSPPRLIPEFGCRGDVSALRGPCGARVEAGWRVPWLVKSYLSRPRSWRERASATCNRVSTTATSASSAPVSRGTRSSNVAPGVADTQPMDPPCCWARISRRNSPSF